MNYSLVGGFFFLLPQPVSLLLIHIELLHIGYYRVGGECPCVIEWVLVIYFINSNVHILVWSNSFLHAAHLYISVIRSFFSKSMRLCLRARSSMVFIFRLHLEVVSYDTDPCLFLCPLLHSEWSSLLSLLWPALALFPISLWLRNIALCTCTPSSVSIQLCFYN